MNPTAFISHIRTDIAQYYDQPGALSGHKAAVDSYISNIYMILFHFSICYEKAAVKKTSCKYSINPFTLNLISHHRMQEGN